MSLNLEGKTQKDLTEFVKKANNTFFMGNQQQHRENDSGKNTYAMPMVIEYVDTMALAALQAASDADDEAEVRESREARLAREARSLDHPSEEPSEHCQRGRMLKRYFHRVRGEPD